MIDIRQFKVPTESNSTHNVLQIMNAYCILLAKEITSLRVSAKHACIYIVPIYISYNAVIFAQNITVYPISTYLLRSMREKGSQFVAQNILKRVSLRMFALATLQNCKTECRIPFMHSMCG